MNNSPQPPLRLRLLLASVMFVYASTLAQDVRQSSDEAGSAARPLLRIAHEWLGQGAPGAGFVCAVIWPTGEYYLERERPLVLSANNGTLIKKSVHEGLLSDRAMRNLNSSIQDGELKVLPNRPAPSNSIETWRFDIFRLGKVQTIHAGTGKSIRSLELFQKTLTSLEKHRPPELSGAKLTNCNNVPRPSLSAKKAASED
jgi:hypothetical protein